jgi:mannose-6-phosphate isomerase
MLYPLRFRPIFKERLWGGRELARLYGKPLPPGKPTGESWEISDRPGDVSVVVNGRLAGKDLHWLMEHHAQDILGSAFSERPRFPLLVKILDARQILSVQVHPPAAVAARLGGEPKTEMWYVTQAGPGACLSAGLKATVSRATFEQHLRAGTVADCIHQVPVKPGDAMFLPSGRVHALGADMVIFEIQQNSDTTYRVFDWNRVGDDGHPRELHVEQALACIDFTDAQPGLVDSPWETAGGVRRRPLVQHPLFTVDEVHAPAPSQQFWSSDAARILGVVSGGLNLEHAASGERLELVPGDFALLPAAAGTVRLHLEEQTVFLAATPGAGGRDAERR